MGSLINMPVLPIGFSTYTLGVTQKMFKELTIAVALTVIFSIGVGVLFIRTLIEMVELFFNGEVDKKETASARGRNNGD